MRFSAYPNLLARRACAVLLTTLLLTSCAQRPSLTVTAQPAPRTPLISISENGVEHTEISILTYNVAGLPWPIGRNRSAALAQISAELDRLRRAGRAPDIVLLQEAFTSNARRIGRVAGYPYRVAGPARNDRPGAPTPALDEAFLAARRWSKGEGIGKLVGSGLYLLSEYPIKELTMNAFGRDTCAGYDCLANKGAMVATIEIPGVPQPLQVMNTHLNARRASGVARSRSLYAHRRQIDELALLLDRTLDPGTPFLFGGDFNTRRSHERYLHKSTRIPGTIVRYYCTQVATDCEVLMSWDGDEPWMDTQDLQGFSSGSQVTVRPTRVEAMFDEPHRGHALSDHDGYLVTYELSWSRTP
jgi:endonuclease/exonuclease/phosphatase family metal-dependent hydrolase